MDQGVEHGVANYDHDTEAENIDQHERQKNCNDLSGLKIDLLRRGIFFLFPFFCLLVYNSLLRSSIACGVRQHPQG